MPKNPNGFSRNLEDNQDEDDKSKLEEAKSSEDDDEEDEKPTISLISIFNSSAKKGESFFTSIFKEDKPTETSNDVKNEKTNVAKQAIEHQSETEATEKGASSDYVNELSNESSYQGVKPGEVSLEQDDVSSIEEESVDASNPEPEAVSQPAIELSEEVELSKPTEEAANVEVDQPVIAELEPELISSLPETNEAIKAEEVELPKTQDSPEANDIEEPVIKPLGQELPSFSALKQKEKVEDNSRSYPPPPVPPPFGAAHNTHNNNVASFMPNNYNFQPSNPSKPAEKTVERVSGGGALLAFLGADLLSRRRDRKIKRELGTEVNTIRERIDHLGNPQLSKTETINRLEKKQSSKLGGVYRKTSEQIRKEAALNIKQEVKDSLHDEQITSVANKTTLNAERSTKPEIVSETEGALRREASSIGEILAVPAFIADKIKDKQIDNRTNRAEFYKRQDETKQPMPSLEQQADRDRSAAKYSRKAEVAVTMKDDFDKSKQLLETKSYEVISQKDQQFRDVIGDSRSNASSDISQASSTTTAHVDRDELIDQHVAKTQSALPVSNTDKMNYTQPILFGMAMAIFILILGLIAYLLLR